MTIGQVGGNTVVLVGHAEEQVSGWEEEARLPVRFDLLAFVGRFERIVVALLRAALTEGQIVDFVVFDH